MTLRPAYASSRILKISRRRATTSARSWMGVGGGVAVGGPVGGGAEGGGVSSDPRVARKVPMPPVRRRASTRAIRSGRRWAPRDGGGGLVGCWASILATSGDEGDWYLRELLNRPLG